MPMRSEVGGNRLAFPQIHLRRKRSTTESWVGGIWARCTRTSVILERFLIFPKSLELSIVLPFYFPNMSENSSNSISPLFGGT